MSAAAGESWAALDRALARRPTAWDGAAIAAAEGSWRVPPDQLPLAEGELVVSRWLDPGPSTSPPVRAGHPDLAGLAGWIRHEVTTGCGLLVIPGLPTAGLDREGAKRAFAQLLWALGTAVPQNVAGDDVHLVIERGGAGFTAGSRGRDALLFHTDQAAAPEELLPELLLLWCLQPAIEGGETQLVSGHAVLRRLLDGHPDLAPQLLAPLPFGRDADGVSDAPPVWSPTYRLVGDGGVRTRYNEYFVRVAERELGVGLDPDQEAVIAAFEAELADDALALELALAPGDLLVVDNRVVLHNRRAYQDPPDDAGRRCLARGWVRLGDQPADRST